MIEFNDTLEINGVEVDVTVSGSFERGEKRCSDYPASRDYIEDLSVKHAGHEMVLTTAQTAQLEKRMLEMVYERSRE